MNKYTQTRCEMNNLNRSIYKIDKIHSLPLSREQIENPKENLSIPYLQCKYKLGYHEAERVYLQLLKQN